MPNIYTFKDEKVKKVISGISFITVNLLSLKIATANQLEPCITAECQEYFKAYNILTKRGHSEAMAIQFG